MLLVIVTKFSFFPGFDENPGNFERWFGYVGHGNYECCFRIFGLGVSMLFITDVLGSVIIT